MRGGGLPKFIVHFSQTVYIRTIWGWGGGDPCPNFLAHWRSKKVEQIAQIRGGVEKSKSPKEQNFFRETVSYAQHLTPGPIIPPILFLLKKILAILCKIPLLTQEKTCYFLKLAGTQKKLSRAKVFHKNKSGLVCFSFVCFLPS